MNMDFTPAERAFREEVRKFLADNLSERLRDGAAHTPGVFVEPDLSLEWQAILHKKGWLAAHWPVEHGGPGWTAMERYIFDKECALAGTPALPILGLRLVGPVICRYGSPEQKAYFLPRILSAEDYWCQGYSEPGAGSDLASLKSTAHRDGDDYVVNGAKIWTTHAHHANWIFCLVRTERGPRKQDGISFLLIPMDQAGISVTPIITLAGDHEVNQVFFDNARTSASNLVGGEGQGWAVAKFLLENERGGSCFAPRLLAHIDRLALAAGNQPSGINGPLIHDQMIAMRIAQLRLEAQALEVTELRILAELSKGRTPGPQTSLVKLIGSGIGQRIEELSVDLFGYEAMQLPLERPLYGNDVPKHVGSRKAQIAMGRYLNSRAATIFGGSDEVQKNIIAKSVLGL